MVSAKVDKEEVTIQSYDTKSLKQLSSKLYADFPKGAEYIDFIKIKEKAFYIYSVVNKKEKTYSVYSREVNTANSQLQKAVNLLTSQGEVVNSKGEWAHMYSLGEGGKGMTNGSKFIIITSFDKSKVAIAYRRKPTTRSDKNSYDKIGVHVFDETLKKQWGNEMTLPHTEAEMNNLAYTVCTDGSAKMLSHLKEDKAFELITFTTDGKVTASKIDVNGELFFQQFKIKEDETGNLICAGFYANGMDFKMDWRGNPTLSFNTNGVMSFEVSPEGKVNNVQDYVFSADFIKQNLTEKQRKKVEDREAKGKAGIGDLRMVEFEVLADGSTVFVGERQYSKIEGEYFFGNAVIIKVDKDGKLLWMRKMAKHQFGATQPHHPNFLGQLSVKYVYSNGAHYVLYIDNPKNATIGLSKPAEKHTNGAGGFLTAYRIDDITGKVEKHTVADLKDVAGIKTYQFNTTRLCKASDENFILEVYIKGKQDVLINFNFK